jgi:hypothetical protein
LTPLASIETTNFYLSFLWDCLLSNIIYLFMSLRKRFIMIKKKDPLFRKKSLIYYICCLVAVIILKIMTGTFYVPFSIMFAKLYLLQLSETWIGVASSQSCRFWALHIPGDGFYKLATVCCMSETFGVRKLWPNMIESYITIFWLELFSVCFFWQQPCSFFKFY